MARHQQLQIILRIEEAKAVFEGVNMPKKKSVVRPIAIGQPL